MVRSVGWFIAAVLWAGGAWGQAPAAASFEAAPTSEPTPRATAPAAASAAPAAPNPSSVSDLVVLKNGDRYRGAIVESTIDGPVVLMLATGQLLSIDRAQVAYAG